LLIAQITDVHLQAVGGLMHGLFDTQAALDATIEHLNRLAPRPDVVLATGDLANHGQPEDYAALRAALERLAMPAYVIPGNHDDRDNLRAAFAGQGYLPEAGPFLHYTIEDYPLRLIGLDTVLPGEVGGGLCEDRLDWLGARLEEAPRRPTLIFMHHPPFATGIGFMDAPGFLGGAALAALIERHPQVRQVICGHIHRSVHVRWAGTAAAVAPSSTFQMNLDLHAESAFAPAGDPPAVGLYLWREDFGAASPISHVSLIGIEAPAHGRPPTPAAPG
jgi:3',5'-cyclic AMP phosphodiesterase CpdA